MVFNSKKKITFIRDFFPTHKPRTQTPFPWSPNPDSWTLNHDYRVPTPKSDPIARKEWIDFFHSHSFLLWHYLFIVPWHKIFIFLQKNENCMSVI